MASRYHKLRSASADKLVRDIVGWPDVDSWGLLGCSEVWDHNLRLEPNIEVSSLYVDYVVADRSGGLSSPVFNTIDLHLNCWPGHAIYPEQEKLLRTVLKCFFELSPSILHHLDDKVKIAARSMRFWDLR